MDNSNCSGCGMPLGTPHLQWCMYANAMAHAVRRDGFTAIVTTVDYVQAWQTQPHDAQRETNDPTA